MKRTVMSVIVLAGALALAGCSGEEPAQDTTTVAGEHAEHNDADVMFAQMMIPHHEQALEMAGLADGRAQDAEVKKIVAAIEKAQDPEIRKMKSWLKAWGRPEAMEGGSGHSMSGMMSDAEMKELAAAKGKDFDRRFAELMIAHHEGAVSMAKTEQQGGADPEAKKVADDVVRTQAAEIAQLKQILARL